MYNPSMTRLRASKARQEFSDTLNRVVYGRERIVLARRGRDLAAIVPMDDLELIRALEDRIDLEKAKKALREKGSVPWKKVKADLGL
jgi:prevent-host-death family protein